MLSTVVFIDMSPELWVFIFWIPQTSNTSTFLLHEVAKNPDLQDKLYNEVTSVLSPDQSPTFEDIQNMPLVRGCSKETLRYILNMGSVQKPATKISCWVQAKSICCTFHLHTGCIQLCQCCPGRLLKMLWFLDITSLQRCNYVYNKWLSL